MKNPKTCKEISTAEDVELAKCLQSRNIFPKDSTDFEGKQVFYNLERVDDNEKLAHFSNEAVSFHMFHQTRCMNLNLCFIASKINCRYTN